MGTNTPQDMASPGKNVAQDVVRSPGQSTMQAVDTPGQETWFGSLQSALGYHPGVCCDACQARPIKGSRFHELGHDYDLCKKCWNKNESRLPPERRARFVRIKYPGAKLWDVDTGEPLRCNQTLAQSQADQNKNQAGDEEITVEQWEHQGVTYLVHRETLTIYNNDGQQVGVWGEPGTETAGASVPANQNQNGNEGITVEQWEHKSVTYLVHRETLTIYDNVGQKIGVWGEGATAGACIPDDGSQSNQPNQNQAGNDGITVEQWEYNGVEYLVHRETLTIYDSEGQKVGMWGKGNTKGASIPEEVNNEENDTSEQRPRSNTEQIASITDRLEQAAEKVTRSRATTEPKGRKSPPTPETSSPQIIKCVEEADGMIADMLSFAESVAFEEDVNLRV